MQRDRRDMGKHVTGCRERRFWRLVTVLAVVELAIIAAAFHWEYLFPSSDVSRLYQRYSHTDGISAVFVKKYRLSDSLCVDLTMLKALNAEAWDSLLSDLNILPPPPDVVKTRGIKGVFIKTVPKKDYRQRPDSIIENNDVMAISFSHRHLTVYNVESKEQASAIKKVKLSENFN